MSNIIECSHCKIKVDLKAHPLVSHVCPVGHVLCESCNDIARAYCFRCGGKTTRKAPNTVEVKELFRIPPELFMRKLINSRTLIVPKGNDGKVRKTTPNLPPVTVIGFKKWPRTFFHKIPDTESKLKYNDRVFKQMLPNIMEDETPPMEPVQNFNWNTLPKSFLDFQLSSEVLECPITDCRYPICNTDATRHLLQSHENLPIKILGRHTMGNFELNPLSARKNEIKALMRILVPGVIKDLGITKHKDCLPLYLLYTRVNVLEAEEDLKKINNTRVSVYSAPSVVHQTCFTSQTFDDEEYAQRYPWKYSDCLLIWCAGIVPLNHPLTIAISVNSRDDNLMNLGALVKVFSLHLPQSGHGIYSNTERLMITRHDFKSLTRKDSIIDGQVCIM